MNKIRLEKPKKVTLDIQDGKYTLFVDGNLVNRPAGLSSQREVMSSIAVISRN